ncbi:MAG: HPF/RaiA family ribosome-associated protein [bacterium]|nr:HPF/RaiA family ribosome-associated protein [bacterium]
MHKRITFRGLPHSDVVEQYANQQLTKIEKFLENERTPVYIDLILEPSKLRQHSRIELRVKSPNYDLISNYEFEGQHFYDVLDRVIDVMYHELCEEKKKNGDKKKMQGRHEDFKKQR